MKLDSRAVFLVLTGAVQTAWAPSFITALKVRLPGARLSVAMTPGALRFLTVDTVRALGVDDIIVDDWEMWSTQKHHVDLAQSADAFIIYPASMSFIAKLAAGSAPGPVLLALQCTGAPIVVCPSLPEGAYENEIIRSNLRRLTDRENLTVMPPHRGQSAWTGREFVGAVADIGEAIACVEAVWAMASGEQNELRSI